MPEAWESPIKIIDNPSGLRHKVKQCASGTERCSVGLVAARGERGLEPRLCWPMFFNTVAHALSIVPQFNLKISGIAGPVVCSHFSVQEIHRSTAHRVSIFAADQWSS